MEGTPSILPELFFLPKKKMRVLLISTAIILSGALGRSAASSTTPTRFKYFLTACAMIRNELHIVLEWIEFHRIQGVEHFIFYDDESIDDIYLLPRLYSDLGYPDVVEIFPVRFLRYNQPWNAKDTDYNRRQSLGLNHCNSRMTGVSQWLLVSDVDEFMFSPKFGTITGYLHNRTDETTREIYVRAVRFGTSGVVRENRVRLSLDPYADRITVANTMFNSDLLITSRNPQREPHPQLDDDYEMRYNKTCPPTTHLEFECARSWGKSIWRPEMCGKAFVHWCSRSQRRPGNVQRPSVEELRFNHYAFRSKEHVDSLPNKKMRDGKKNKFDAVDGSWFSSVEDRALNRYKQDLVSRLRMFPTKTLDHEQIK